MELFEESLKDDASKFPSVVSTHTPKRAKEDISTLQSHSQLRIIGHYQDEIQRCVNRAVHDGVSVSEMWYITGLRPISPTLSADELEKALWIASAVTAIFIVATLTAVKLYTRKLFKEK